ncbi:hypothetical protein BH11VER1_BH11VER1_20640 [soil metagenome]
MAMLDLPQTPHTLAEGLTLLFALVIGHVLGDYPLQGEYLALNKNRHYRPTHGIEQPKGLWIHCLGAHCLIHAGLVWLISGRLVFGLIEFVLHFIIDAYKCEKKTSFHTDQFLHVSCRVGYVVALIMEWVK